MAGSAPPTSGADRWDDLVSFYERAAHPYTASFAQLALDSPEGSPRFALLEEAHSTMIDPMFAASTETAAGLLAKLQAVKEGGSTMLDMQVHPAYTALDVILSDVERLANQGVAFVPWQVEGESVAPPSRDAKARVT